VGDLRRFIQEGAVALWAAAEVRSSAQAVQVLRVTGQRDLHETVRGQHALLVAGGGETLDCRGFGAVLVRGDAPPEAHGAAVVHLPDALAYLGEGDVVRIDGRRHRVDTLFRRWSRHNTLLLTERCNSYCVMCSQPPRTEDDGNIVEELLQAIPLFHPEAEEVGFTGGEPTLLGDGLLRLIASMRDWMPRTKLHILSNGRRLCDFDLASRVAGIKHPNVVFGIPLYADNATDHDFVVQSLGAFVETVHGLRNLARLGVAVELRVVVHRWTYARLSALARFITRNLTFVSQVSLMGLETIGFAKSNLDDIWIDPADYQVELRDAVSILRSVDLPVAIFNHQLCVLDRGLWEFAVQSISDWKNIYLPACGGCRLQSACGGFFASNVVRYSRAIRPPEEGLGL